MEVGGTGWKYQGLGISYGEAERRAAAETDETELTGMKLSKEIKREAFSGVSPRIWQYLDFLSCCLASSRLSSSLFSLLFLFPRAVGSFDAKQLLSAHTPPALYHGTCCGLLTDGDDSALKRAAGETGVSTCSKPDVFCTVQENPDRVTQRTMWRCG
jgi:hypothetical protein